MGGKSVAQYRALKPRAPRAGFLDIKWGFAMTLGRLLKRGYYKSMENTDDKP